MEIWMIGVNLKNLGRLLILSLLITSCGKGLDDPEDCNGDSTRRDVKIAVDADTALIDHTPIPIGVLEFGQLSVPEVHKEDGRQTAEMKVYTITAKVHKLSHHRDGDWKIKLTDDQDHYVNCENPNPECTYAANSQFLINYKTVREWIQANKDDLEGKTVTVTGIGFIDVDHRYPRNSAANEMEIHPILDIHF